jgi:hypothetical protein
VLDVESRPPDRRSAGGRLFGAAHSPGSLDLRPGLQPAPGRDGHLWRSRFYSCPLGPSHLDAALLYVDLNPVRAAMTETATAWPWSSARAHVTGHDESGLLAAGRLAEMGGCADWRDRLSRGQAESAERALRTATSTGTPFADAAFREELERRLGLSAGHRTDPLAATETTRAAAARSR